MKKVRMLTATAYKGPRKEGDIVSVPDDFAHRWVKNKIAEYVEEVESEEGAAENEEAVEENEQGAPDYESMSAKDLFALCKEKGLDVEPRQGKEYYIEKLG